MTERDAFEIRFAAAVHGYVGRVSSDLDPAEFAHRIATREPRRQRHPAALALHGLAIPRRTWVLLLLAALLTALVAGMLVVGSQPVQKLPAVVPPVGQVFACPPGSTPDRPGPVDQARPTDPGPTMAFDRHAGRLVALTATVAGPVETWTFDVCTNTWTRMHPNREPPPGGYGQLVYDVDSDLMIASDGTRMWVYDLDVNTWTEKGPFAPFVYPRFAGLRFYDPMSGLVIALGDDGNDATLGLALWGYAVETDTWTPIPQANPLTIGPHYEFFAYDASVDRLVAYANGWGPLDSDGNRLFEAKVWLLDLRTGTWSSTSAVAPQFSAGWWGHVPGIAYDEAAERIVMSGQGHSAAYDASADRWETLYMTPFVDQPSSCASRPECRQMPQMVDDPVNERLVGFGGFVLTAAGVEVWPNDLRAFDTRTREWTVLLEASEESLLPTR